MKWTNLFRYISKMEIGDEFPAKIVYRGEGKPMRIIDDTHEDCQKREVELLAEIEHLKAELSVYIYSASETPSEENQRLRKEIDQHEHECGKRESEVLRLRKAIGELRKALKLQSNFCSCYRTGREECAHCQRHEALASTEEMEKP